MRARSRRPRRWLPVAVALGLLMAGCASDAPLNTWDPAGSQAQKIQDLQVWVFAIAGVVGLAVFVVAAYIMIRFRHRKGHEDEVPRQIHGAPRLEVMWTIAPAVLLAFVAVFTVRTLFDLAKSPSNPLRVTVIGQQWWWEFQYPDLKDASGQPIVTADEMVIPAGKNVELAITSRDVIHSFWIPRLNGKRDAVPGRVHPLTMEADQPGEFYGQCTEFCGLSHANMRMRVVALTDSDFATWVENQHKPAADATQEVAAAGQTVFKSQCVRCHTINGLKDATTGQALVSQADQQLVAGAAPNLTHLMSRTTFAGAVFDLKRPGCTGDLQGLPTGTPVNCLNSNQLSAWLRNAPGVLPMFVQPNAEGKYRGMPNLGLSETQIAQLVAYLATLK
jgi:cytochrome c oxidase subunit 2